MSARSPTEKPFAFAPTYTVLVSFGASCVSATGVPIEPP